MAFETKKTVLILGGYGNTGLPTARLLLQECDAEVIVAGRNLDRAQRTADELNREFNTDRASGKQVDAANSDSLKAAFVGVDMVVVASSTMDYVHDVACAALETDTDYLDVQLSCPPKLDALHRLREEIEERGRCFITDGGYHPGVPAAMVWFAATQFDALEVANVSAAFQLDLSDMRFSASTTSEFIEELKSFDPLVLKDGQWSRMSMRELPKVDFGESFGEKSCTPMFMEELRSLPEQIPTLRETGFYIAGFNWVTDYVVMPIAFIAMKLFGDRAKEPMGKLFRWSLKHFSKPPFGAVIQVEAKGLKDDQNARMRMRLNHDDAYMLTAIPVVATLLQYLNGDNRSPGLWFQANFVEPIQFFQDLERLGVGIVIQSDTETRQELSKAF